MAEVSTTNGLFCNYLLRVTRIRCLPQNSVVAGSRLGSGTFLACYAVVNEIVHLKYGIVA